MFKNKMAIIFGKTNQKQTESGVYLSDIGKGLTCWKIDWEIIKLFVTFAAKKLFTFNCAIKTNKRTNIKKKVNASFVNL